MGARIVLTERSRYLIWLASSIPLLYPVSHTLFVILYEKLHCVCLKRFISPSLLSMNPKKTQTLALYLLRSIQRCELTTWLDRQLYVASIFECWCTFLSSYLSQLRDAIINFTIGTHRFPHSLLTFFPSRLKTTSGSKGCHIQICYLRLFAFCLRTLFCLYYL